MKALYFFGRCSGGAAYLVEAIAQVRLCQQRALNNGKSSHERVRFDDSRDVPSS
jgi:hypothetical protein